MLTIEEAKRTFRGPNQADYPELKDCAREDIYRDCYRGGALYLAVRMSRTLRLKPGEIVLDLGCGKGETSIFLARHFGVQVIALDLWTSATDLNCKFAARGYRNQIVPVNRPTRMWTCSRMTFANSTRRCGGRACLRPPAC